jgi:hypothetical protein
VSAPDFPLTVIVLMGPLVAGGAFCYWLVRGWRGVILALALGGLLTLGGLAIWYLDAPYVDAPNSDLDCFECSEYRGRWMDPTMFTVWVPWTLSLWTLGVFWSLWWKRSVLGGGQMTRPSKRN